MRFAVAGWAKIAAGAAVLSATALALGQESELRIAEPASSAPRATATRRSAPQTWGTSQVTYYSVGGLSLMPRVGTTTFGGVDPALRYQKNTTGLGLEAPLHLPAGARIVYLQLEFYDTTVSGEVQAELDVCSFDGQTCTPQYGIPSCGDAIVTICSGTVDAPGFGIIATDMSNAGIVVDNYFKGYRVLAGTTTNDGTTAIGRVLVGYVLQVSPEAGYASFTDVPVSHPFHRYVEALLLSQITAGCGNNNYCPDAPLTRGQMAVFLAKALGLQWN